MHSAARIFITEPCPQFTRQLPHALSARVQHMTAVMGHSLHVRMPAFSSVHACSWHHRQQQKQPNLLFEYSQQSKSNLS